VRGQHVTGIVDTAYDVAVSTAAGALDALVTDTTEGAERCVKFLRDHQLGTATFLMLDRLPQPSPVGFIVFCFDEFVQN